jgi:hypothetical protein
LEPKFTIPFAADYVLLNESREWINQIKITKHEIESYYTDVYKGGGTQFLVMHSGDAIENQEHVTTSPYHAAEREHRLDHLIREQLSEARERVNTIEPINEEDVERLIFRMTENIKTRMALFSAEVLERIQYTIIVRDVVDNGHFFIDCSGSEVHISRGNSVNPKSILTIETTSKILNYSFDSEWGGDAIVIGYGAEIHILDKSIIGKNLDIICVRLLTRQPVASKQMKQSPFRALKYLSTNPVTTSWAVKQLVKSRKSVNKNPVNERSLWLNKSKCEICQVCDVPYLTEAFSESLK